MNSIKFFSLALIAFSLAVADLLTGTAIPVVIISYMLKFQTDSAWDVRYRNLELLSPIAPNSAATSSSTRRKLARCAQRKADASKASASMPTRITA